MLGGDAMKHYFAVLTICFLLFSLSAVADDFVSAWQFWLRAGLYALLLIVLVDAFVVTTTRLVREVKS